MGLDCPSGNNTCALNPINEATVWTVQFQSGPGSAPGGIWTTQTEVAFYNQQHDCYLSLTTPKQFDTLFGFQPTPGCLPGPVSAASTFRMEIDHASWNVNVADQALSLTLTLTYHP